MNKGIILLIVFWLVGWFLPAGLHNKVRRDNVRAPFILGPLTIPEKILFGFSLEINSLSQKDWEMLPGIGPAVAKRILEYKIEHGPFADLPALDNVKGIGPKTIASLRQFFDAFPRQKLSF